MKKTPFNLNLKWVKATCVCICIANSLTASTIEELYVTMPDSLHASVSATSRSEMLAYYSSGFNYHALNRFDNKIRILMVDTLHDYIKIQSTKTSTFELKRMIYTTHELLSIIRTVCSPACMSTIHFFDSHWRPLPIEFTLPKAIDWLDTDALKASGLDETWVNNSLQTSYLSLSFDTLSNALVVRNNLLEFLSLEHRAVLEKMLHNHPIYYQLIGTKFVKQTTGKEY